MQPQGHVQVAVALADDHADPQAALDCPRFFIEEGQPSGQVALEEGIPVEVMASPGGFGSHDPAGQRHEPLLVWPWSGDLPRSAERRFMGRQ